MPDDSLSPDAAAPQAPQVPLAPPSAPSSAPNAPPAPDVSGLSPDRRSPMPAPQVDEQTLSQALDEYESAPPAKRKSLEPDIYQQIIRFRSRLAKGMDEDERHALERRVAAYSNSLVKRK
jgi:hypothetical protein